MVNYSYISIIVAEYLLGILGSVDRKVVVNVLLSDI